MARSGAQRVARVASVPVELFLESQDHQEDLLRELRLMELGDRFHLTTDSVAQDLASLIGGILGRYRDVRSTTRTQALAALADGRTEVTLLVPLDDGIVDALHHWLELLETANRVCAGGRLLTLPARPEVQALRRWYVDEVVLQATGPVPTEE